MGDESDDNQQRRRRVLKSRRAISKAKQSMTCDVRLQLAEIRCAVASCNVLAEPILVVTCDVCACGAF